MTDPDLDPEPVISSDSQTSAHDADLDSAGSRIGRAWHLVLGSARRVALANCDVKDDASKKLLRQLVYDLLFEADRLYALIPREDVWQQVDSLEQLVAQQNDPIAPSDLAFRWECCLRHEHRYARERWLKNVQEELHVNFTHLAGFPGKFKGVKMPDFKTWTKFKDYGVMRPDQQKQVEAVLNRFLPDKAAKLMNYFRTMLDPDADANLPAS